MAPVLVATAYTVSPAPKKVTPGTAVTAPSTAPPCRQSAHTVPPRAGVKVGVRGFCCMSRFDVFSGLQAEQVEGLQAGVVPAEVAAGCGVVRQAGAVQDADDGAGDGGEQPGGAPGPQP